GGVAESLEALKERVKARPGFRSLPSPPLMHGAAHWVAFNMWHVGATIVIQSEVERLDPDDIWSTVERERINAIAIVGDAFARPLLDQLDEKNYDLSTLKLVTSGGAIFTAALKRELLSKLPNVRIMDALGSSETGTQATHFSTVESGVSTGHFDMSEGNVVLRDDLSGIVAPGSSEIGWLARSGNVPPGYYNNPEATAAAITPDGVRITKRGSQKPYFGFTVNIKSLPVLIAFDVFARIDGREHRVGAIYGGKGKGDMSWGIGHDYDGAQVSSCDLVFRASKDVARGTVDLFEIWDGELVYENISVTVK
ncbi:MAG: AMP-binding protein, partial [Armatimonadetes bacterium]|nr:AMP-binding protein [Armatimonadota bacterium]